MQRTSTAVVTITVVICEHCILGTGEQSSAANRRFLLHNWLSAMEVVPEKRKNLGDPHATADEDDLVNAIPPAGRVPPPPRHQQVHHAHGSRHQITVELLELGPRQPARRNLRRPRSTGPSQAWYPSRSVPSWPSRTPPSAREARRRPGGGPGGASPR